MVAADGQGGSLGQPTVDTMSREPGEGARANAMGYGVRQEQMYEQGRDDARFSGRVQVRRRRGAVGGRAVAVALAVAVAVET